MENVGYKTSDSSSVVPVACSAVLAIGLGATAPAYGVSVAEFDRQDEIRQHGLAIDVGKSYSYALSASDRMCECLAALPTQYCSRNWNGYDEAPISVESWNHANDFVRGLPTWVSEAEVSIDADGEISLEWYRSKTEYLELVFGASGCVHLFMQTKVSKCSDLFRGDVRAKLMPYIAEFENV